ncbi:MAG: L-threonine 3-dehydrogenase [Phycisphaeraceae bacterium]|nr:L-threonine 3-dehydrogenase [Phycisphaeraceae bacterium]MCB9846962.1 L-threonine 3-dehydrogenase [Phycisphaeraceae bacterium]
MTQTPTATTTESEPHTAGAAVPARTMRALVKSKAEPGLWFDGQRRLPTGSSGIVGAPGPTEAMIRVKMAGVCGTDRHIYEWDHWAQSRIPVGIVTGHEFVGEIVAVGQGVTRVKVGQRVTAEGHITKGTDFNSRTGNAHIARDMRILGVDRDGCFADYVIVPQYNVWPLHEDVPDRIAAVMDPLGNAVHTVMTAGVSAQSVLITGAGIIGLMAVTVARAAGASKIFVTDVDPRRLELAKELGADFVFDPTRGDDWIGVIDQHTPGGGCDVLLEMSGAASAINAGFTALRNGGTAALLGIPGKPIEFDLSNHVIFKGARIFGVNGRRMWATWYQMEELILSGRLKLDKIITHTLPFEDYERAFKLMQSGDGIKIVLDLTA